MGHSRKAVSVVATAVVGAVLQGSYTHGIAEHVDRAAGALPAALRDRFVDSFTSTGSVQVAVERLDASWTPAGRSPP